MKKLILTTLIAATTLQGCLFLAGAAVGVGAVGVVVYDKRSPKVTEDDQHVTQQIQEKLNAVPEIKNQAHIVVSTFNRVVLLAGQAPNAAIRDEAVAIAHTVSGYNKIYDQITINGETSSLTSVSDNWITTKIKTGLATRDELATSQIQVVTENGTVYLMGTVTRSQADLSVSVAQKVSGVQKVVKVFEYTDEAKDQSGLE